MSTYEERCKQIIEEAGLVRTDFIDSVKVHSIILELFQKRCLKKKIALWGAGYNNTLTSHAAVLLTKYATCLQGVECLIDSCKEVQGKMLFGHPIIAPEELAERDIDIVIISSRSSAESIKKSLEKFGPKCESLDIYQELRNAGIDIHYNFYEERSFYSELYELRVAYENAEEEEKEQYLHKLISSYLKIKDFYYAFAYMEEYVQKQYANSDKVAKAKTELEELILEVSRKNQLRKNDISIHYIDALRAVDTFGAKENEYKVLKEYLAESAVFKDIHSTAPTTYESIYSITKGLYPFTENVYEDRFIFAPEEFGIMNKAFEKGYKVNLYTSAEWRIIKEDERVNYINQIHLTDKLWKMACDVAESEKPVFSYLYYPWELHFPLLCGYHNKKPVAMGFKDVGIVDMSDFIEGQLADCLQYVDKQFEFFKKVLPDNGYTVLFSDHSQIVYDAEKCVPFFAYYNDTERSTHCVLAIKGPDIEHKEYTQLASLIDFNKIVGDFIWNNRQEVQDSEVIRYQYYSTHNKQFRDVALERGLANYIDGIQCFKSKDYIYCVTRTGVEEVYSCDNLKVNIIKTQHGKDFAEKIKKQYRIEFPEFLEIHY